MEERESERNRRMNNEEERESTLPLTLLLRTGRIVG